MEAGIALAKAAHVNSSDRISIDNFPRHKHRVVILRAE